MSEGVKCIGIIGGMSPQSTVTYYQTIIRLHHEAEGDHTYPRIVIGSISFQQLSDACHDGEWDRVRDIVQDEGDALTVAGADFLLISANTIHKIMPDLRFSRPLLTIYDAVSVAAREKGFKRLGLTGTGFTMSDGFYEEALRERGLEMILPSQEDQQTVHRIIYDELTSGTVLPESQRAFAEVSARLAGSGAEAILLACTELELLTRDFDPGVPTLDTTFAHAEAAWKVATGRAEYPLVTASGD